MYIYNKPVTLGFLIRAADVPFLILNFNLSKVVPATTWLPVLNTFCFTFFEGTEKLLRSFVVNDSSPANKRLAKEYFTIQKNNFLTLN